MLNTARYTYLPEGTCLLSLWIRVPDRSCYRHNVRSTRRNRPTEAWCLSHVLPERHSTGRWCLPRSRSPQAGTHRYRSADSSQPPEVLTEVHLPEPEHCRTSGSERSGSARPVTLTGEYPVTELVVDSLFTDTHLLDDVRSFFL